MQLQKTKTKILGIICKFMHCPIYCWVLHSLPVKYNDNSTNCLVIALFFKCVERHPSPLYHCNAHASAFVFLLFFTMFPFYEN